jgi:Pyruvate/2-oxoacid:ferredoxin oxidoreductase delta subunit
MSRPFDGMFQCDQCHAYLDLDYYAGTYEVDGKEYDYCKGCEEDNEIKESA